MGLSYFLQAYKTPQDSKAPQASQVYEKQEWEGTPPCVRYITYLHTPLNYIISASAADSQPALNRNGGRGMAFLRICSQHQALVCGDLRHSIERILSRRCFYDCVLHHRIARKPLGSGTKLWQRWRARLNAHSCFMVMSLLGRFATN